MNYDKIIDNFFIISCKKSKINKYIQNSKINYEIIFNIKHQKNNSLKKTKENNMLKKDIIKFIIPFKKKLKIKYTKNNINKINELLFKEKKNDFFFIKLNGNNKKRHFNKILKSFNPLEQDYYYVFEIRDFFLNDYNNNFENDEEVDEIDAKFFLDLENEKFGEDFEKKDFKKFNTFYCLNNNNLENFEKKDKKKNEKSNNSLELENFDDLEIIFFNKYYVLKTLYPLSTVYLKFFLDYNNLIKSKKLEIFKKSIQEKKINYKILQKLDSEIFLKYEKIQLQNLLNYFFTTSINQNLKINFKNKKNFNINYNISIKTSESEIALKKILSKIPFLDFIFLFLSLIQEKSLIIVSTSKYNISFVISILLSLLKPFIWVFPVIYNLPENCLDMLFSPVPIICGINKNSFEMINDILPKYKVGKKIEFIVYFFDENFFFFDYDILKSYFVPNFNNFFFEFENLFRGKFNGDFSDNFKVDKNSKILKLKMQSLKKNKNKYNKLKKKYMKIEKVYNFDSFINNNLNQFDTCLLNFLNDFYIESIFHHIKKRDYKTKNDLIKANSFLKKNYKNKNDLFFFEKLQRTQFFINYLENKLF